MENIYESIEKITKKVSELQRIYNEKLIPMIEYFNIHNFDFEIFTQKFIPILFELLEKNLDKNTYQFIGRISESFVRLIDL